MITTWLKWGALALLSLLAKVLNYPLALILPVFASEDGYLPKVLSWFQTPDNSLDGDTGWKEEHWQWRYKLPLTLAIYVGRVGWLWRNSLYGFKIDVLGFEVKEDFDFRWIGNKDVSDRPLSRGYVYRKVVNKDGTRAFQFYLIYPYSFTEEKRCLRLMFGWKLWQNPTEGNKQLALSIMPWKSYDDGERMRP